LFYDEPSQTYYIFWATSIPGRHKNDSTGGNEKDLNHRIYYVTTKDFNIFSDTNLFFDPDFNVIDAAIVKGHKDELIMFMKNENSNPTEKNIRTTTTDNIADGFPAQVSGPITGDYWAEGPSPLIIGDYIYVYFDKYRDRKYGAVRTKDYVNWEDVSDQVSFPQGARHGTAFVVDKEALEQLLQLP
jgi:beta-galactosidase